MNKEQESIRQIEYESVNAFLERDIKALDRILTDEFIITDPHGPSFTKAQYLADLGAANISFRALVIDERQVKPTMERAFRIQPL